MRAEAQSLVAEAQLTNVVCSSLAMTVFENEANESCIKDSSKVQGSV